jgi:hypothetical protein
MNGTTGHNDVGQGAGRGVGDGGGCAHAEQLATVQSALAGLAREVEAMRRAMRQVPTAADLARLAATVAELSETTAAMQATGGRRGEPDPVPSWLTLPHDAHSARAVLGDLTEWLGDVYLRYGDAARDFPGVLGVAPRGRRGTGLADVRLAGRLPRRP